MRTRRLIGPCLAACVAVAGHSSVSAQPGRSDKADRSANPSHVAIPFNPPASGQFADFLKSRDPSREAREAFERLQNLFQKLDQKQQEEVLRQLGRPLEALTKEEMLPLLDKVRDSLPKMDGSPEAKSGLLQEELDAVRDRVRQLPTGASMKPPMDLPAADGKIPQAIPPDQRSPNREGSGQPISPPQPEPSTEEKGDALRDKLADWWTGSPLANSEAIRNLGRKLSQPLAGSGNGARGEGLFEKLQNLGSHIPFKDLFARGTPRPQTTNAPRSGASASGPLGADTPQGSRLSGLLWIGLAVVALVLIWKLLASRRSAAGDAPRPWQLGAWPVDPAHVGTREDLVRAFEYLSLLLLGPAARNWNHRVIAHRMSRRPNAADEDRRRAAEHLAALYEKARYAPPADPLPEGEVRDARRDLCLLAGVAHA